MRWRRKRLGSVLRWDVVKVIIQSPAPAAKWWTNRGFILPCTYFIALHFITSSFYVTKNIIIYLNIKTKMNCHFRYSHRIKDTKIKKRKVKPEGCKAPKESSHSLSRCTNDFFHDSRKIKTKEYFVRYLHSESGFIVTSEWRGFSFAYRFSLTVFHSLVFIHS
jgi:hypothetical protein